MTVRKSPRRTRRLALAALSAAGVAMSACGITLAAHAADLYASAEPTIFYSAEQMPDVWAADTAEFPELLAPGVDWPSEPPSALTTEGVVNEEGLSALTASFYWLCSWEEAYLDAVATHDARKEMTAVEAMSGFTELPAVERGFVNKEEWRAAVLDPVIAGVGPGSVIDDFDIATCDWYPSIKEEQQ